SRRAGEAIWEVSNRVFVVVQASPARPVKSIQVLTTAQLAQAELVILETRRGVLREQLAQTLAEHLPGLPISAVLACDSRQAQRARGGDPRGDGRRAGRPGDRVTGPVRRAAHDAGAPAHRLELSAIRHAVDARACIATVAPLASSFHAARPGGDPLLPPRLLG